RHPGRHRRGVPAPPLAGLPARADHRGRAGPRLARRAHHPRPAPGPRARRALHRGTPRVRRISTREVTRMTVDPTPEIPLDRFSTIADGLDHPECVAVGPDGRLYAGGEAGQIYRLDPEGPTLLANTGGFVLGICLDADSVIYACDQFRHEVVR